MKQILEMRMPTTFKEDNDHFSKICVCFLIYLFHL